MSRRAISCSRHVTSRRVTACQAVPLRAAPCHLCHGMSGGCHGMLCRTRPGQARPGQAMSRPVPSRPVAPCRAAPRRATHVT
eukprot:9658010-Alexandrium_andersonii.AAC.1